ncbi:uncharacterized protein LOC119598389 [Penaeus monodon]|uniref:uncharacterized protein LOC119598389 n=1 Tax=Penaeus monodon TaxID=6687 RepID=UPI0018A75535|nr:uncharacterized protein LOC119598389 [Penaeus monodon]
MNVMERITSKYSPPQSSATFGKHGHSSTNLLEKSCGGTGRCVHPSEVDPTRCDLLTKSPACPASMACCVSVKWRTRKRRQDGEKDTSIDLYPKNKKPSKPPFGGKQPGAKAGKRRRGNKKYERNKHGKEEGRRNKKGITKGGKRNKKSNARSKKGSRNSKRRKQKREKKMKKKERNEKRNKLMGDHKEGKRKKDGNRRTVSKNRLGRKKNEKRQHGSRNEKRLTKSKGDQRTATKDIKVFITRDEITHSEAKDSSSCPTNDQCLRLGGCCVALNLANVFNCDEVNNECPNESSCRCCIGGALGSGGAEGGESVLGSYEVVSGDDDSWSYCPLTSQCGVPGRACVTANVANSFNCDSVTDECGGDCFCCIGGTLGDSHVGSGGTSGGGSGDSGGSDGSYEVVSGDDDSWSYCPLTSQCGVPGRACVTANVANSFNCDSVTDECGGDCFCCIGGTLGDSHVGSGGSEDGGDAGGGGGGAGGGGGDTGGGGSDGGDGNGDSSGGGKFCEAKWKCAKRGGVCRSDELHECKKVTNKCGGNGCFCCIMEKVNECKQDRSCHSEGGICMQNCYQDDKIIPGKCEEECSCCVAPEIAGGPGSDGGDGSNNCKQKKHCLKAGGECKGNCLTDEVTVPGLCVKGCQCCIPEGKLKAMEMSRVPISNNKIFQILWVLKEEMVMEALMTVNKRSPAFELEENARKTALRTKSRRPVCVRMGASVAFLQNVNKRNTATALEETARRPVKARRYRSLDCAKVAVTAVFPREEIQEAEFQAQEEIQVEEVQAQEVQEQEIQEVEAQEEIQEVQAQEVQAQEEIQEVQAQEEIQEVQAQEEIQEVQAQEEIQEGGTSSPNHPKGDRSLHVLHLLARETGRLRPTSLEIETGRMSSQTPQTTGPPYPGVKACKG